MNDMIPLGLMIPTCSLCSPGFSRTRNPALYWATNLRICKYVGDIIDMAKTLPNMELHCERNLHQLDYKIFGFC